MDFLYRRILVWADVIRIVHRRLCTMGGVVLTVRNRWYRWCLCCCMVFFVLGHARARAETRLTLRSSATQQHEIKVSPGETLDLELFVEMGDIQVNGISVLILFDPDYLRVLDAETTTAGVQPCEPGPFLPGLILQNELDTNDPGKSKILYSIGSISGAASGSGVVAQLHFDVLASIHTTMIELVIGSPIPLTLYSVAGPEPRTEAFDTLTSVSVHILGIPSWDVNQDGMVDIMDLVSIGRHFGEMPLLEPRADVNQDGMVDILDLVTIGRHFGERYMGN